jgi:hypothetical protein
MASARFRLHVLEAERSLVARQQALLERYRARATPATQQPAGTTTQRRGKPTTGA